MWALSGPRMPPTHTHTLWLRKPLRIMEGAAGEGQRGLDKGWADEELTRNSAAGDMAHNLCAAIK